MIWLEQFPEILEVCQVPGRQQKEFVMKCILWMNSASGEVSKCLEIVWDLRVSRTTDVGESKYCSSEGRCLLFYCGSEEQLKLVAKVAVEQEMFTEPVFSSLRQALISGTL